jgi:methylenetetrahydrofolate--tRNA-(uracil-5-)-methyltransferase
MTTLTPPPENMRPLPATQERPTVAVLGGGLAGSEAALQLAQRGVAVQLYDMKPVSHSPAHHSLNYAEVVCSNSFGSLHSGAPGLLKQEMALLGSYLLAEAHQCAVPAGQALAVDRERFAERITQKLTQNPLITCIGHAAESIPTDVAACLVATGPMTTPALAQTLGQLTGQAQLYFFDAAAPIVTRESVDMSKAFVADRYDHSNSGSSSYINCPMTKDEYDRFYAYLTTAERIPLKSFEEAEKASFFEGCMPVEVIASRGEATLRFGPMKPVGLVNPHTGEQPYAVVQLRQDNAEGTLYNLVGFQTNLKWGEQKALLALIPGLENADVVRYGVMHRNTYLHSPKVLEPTLRFKDHPTLWLAGQLTGTEGYSESIAGGLWAGRNIARVLAGQPALVPPPETMLGALLRYITRPEAADGEFQPINSNWGLMPPLPERVRSKKERADLNTQRALAAWHAWQTQHPDVVLAKR